LTPEQPDPKRIVKLFEEELSDQQPLETVGEFIAIKQKNLARLYGDESLFLLSMPRVHNAMSYV